MVGCFLILWTLFKVGAGTYDLLSVPAYFDDTYANWNMRAKVFTFSESLLLDLPREHELYFGGRVPGYPLTVYFTKAWLAMVHGGLLEILGENPERGPAPHRSAASGAGWSEAVVNSVHLVWFVALLVLLFCALRRTVPFPWACLGVYLFVSLPLVLVHGTNPYSDIAMGGYLFLALFWFYRWGQVRMALNHSLLTSLGARVSGYAPLPGVEDEGRVDGAAMHPNMVSGAWLRLFSLATAAMLFVKSEALLLFLPPLTLLFLCVWWKHEWGKPGAWSTLAPYAGTVALVAVPWTVFKILNGLEFGNAQTVSGFALTVNEGVPGAVFNHLFYTGSYLLFIPLVLLTLALTGRSLKGSSRFALLLFLVIVFTGEFFIYYLTPLGTEAIRHTGLGRGIVQLLPVAVFLLVPSLARFPFGSPTIMGK